jgi:hypothetical protein
MSRVGQSGAEWSGEMLGVACERGTGTGERERGVKACWWVRALKSQWDGGRHCCHRRDECPGGDPGRTAWACASGHWSS